MALNAYSSKFYSNTLREMCIDCIVSNFSRFMQAYDNASIPVQYFEFLQRTLSKELFQRLSVQTAFDVHYFSFLINPHLRELNLSYYFSDAEPILERLQETGRSIKFLNLNQKPWHEDVLLKFVAAVPMVETLLLKGTECSDYVPRTIGEQCKYLLKLDVSYSTCVSNDGIKDFLGRNEDGTFKKNMTLQYLDLSSTSVSDSAVSVVLGHMPMLRTLNHDHVVEVIYDKHATDFVSGHVDRISKYLLTSLNFYSLGANNHYSSEMLANVVQICSTFCPNVTSIKIDGELNESVITMCAKFKELKDVQLSNVLHEPPANSLYSFIEARGPTLLNFELKNFFIPMKLLSEYCHRLHTLTICGSEFSEFESLTGVDSFPCLRELSVEDAYFEHNSASQSVIYLVSNSPRLEILSLRHATLLTVDVINTLSRCKCMKTLQCIDVSYSDLNAAGAMAIITSASKLDKFLIERVSISNDEYKELHDISCSKHVTILWRAISSYSSDNDDEHLYDGYDFEGFDDYMGYSDEYDDYDTDYSGDEFFHVEL